MTGADGRPNLFWRVAVVFAAVTLVWLFVAQGLGSLFGPAYSDRVAMPCGPCSPQSATPIPRTWRSSPRDRMSCADTDRHENRVA